MGGISTQSTKITCCAQTGHIECKYVKRLLRCGDLCFFSRWWLSTISDWWSIFCDNPQRALKGLYRCAKMWL